MNASGGPSAGAGSATVDPPRVERLMAQFRAAVERVWGPQPETVGAALEAAVRGPSFGHVCVELSDIFAPSVLPGAMGELSASSVVHVVGTQDDAASPLVIDDGRVYLRRYWEYEREVAARLRPRLRVASAEGDPRGDTAAASAAETVIRHYFPDGHTNGEDRQLLAVERGLDGRFLMLVGGPGTGKTRTVAVLLAALAAAAGSDDDTSPLRVALAAPTGKAAARMTEAVHQELRTAGWSGLSGIEGQTIHRLLGYRWPDQRQAIGFEHDAANPVPYDVVIVDEMSMVSLPLMRDLLEAIGPDTRLVLVGDPFQLVSVEAGSVLRDVVGPALDASLEAPSVVVLNRSRRFDEASAIAALASAVQRGDVDACTELLRSGAEDVGWLDAANAPDAFERAIANTAAGDALLDHVRALVAAGRHGDADASLDLLGRSKVLCATHTGPLGTARVNRVMRQWAVDELGAWHGAEAFLPGEPVLITRNDYANQLFNGDGGVCLSTEAGARIGFDSAEGPRLFSPARLDGAESNYAMSVHKSQGSEYDRIVICLPQAGSAILSRELLYTAITRARTGLTIVGSLDAVAAAVERVVRRPSGLESRIWGA